MATEPEPFKAPKGPDFLGLPLVPPGPRFKPEADVLKPASPKGRLWRVSDVLGRRREHHLVVLTGVDPVTPRFSGVRCAN